MFAAARASASGTSAKEFGESEVEGYARTSM